MMSLPVWRPGRWPCSANRSPRPWTPRVIFISSWRPRPWPTAIPCSASTKRCPLPGALLKKVDEGCQVHLEELGQLLRLGQAEERSRRSRLGASAQNKALQPNLQRPLLRRARFRQRAEPQHWTNRLHRGGPARFCLSYPTSSATNHAAAEGAGWAPSPCKPSSRMRIRPTSRPICCPRHVRRAARAIMQCRTAALGGHVQACPNGHPSPDLVQFVPPSVLSAVRLSPDGALAGRCNAPGCWRVDRFHVIVTLPA